VAVSPITHIREARRKLARWGVERTDEAAQARVGQRHLVTVAGGAQRARMMPRLNHKVQGTPSETLAESSVRVKRRPQSANPDRSTGESSGAAARGTWWHGTIREKIIGHRMSVGVIGLCRRRFFGGEDGKLALLDEPARQHGGSVFFKPLIKQSSDFLAEIGSVSEAGKLVGLQGGAGSGEKKFPRSLGTELGHEALLTAGLRKHRAHINANVIHASSALRITRLWKAVENEENAERLCSGCAGDYEDPERSAWEDEEEMGELNEAKKLKEVKE